MNKTVNSVLETEIAQEPDGTSDSLGTVGTNTLSLRIGADNIGENAFAGVIDEPVISSSVRSADWMKLCYMNQKKADALVILK